MRSRIFLLCFASLLIASLRAQTTSSGSAANGSRTAARAPAKGPLPDPALLDGSAQPVEKHPDYGMLGDFELPGDDNAKSGKMGGQQNPEQKGGGGGQQQQNQSQNGGGGQMAGLPAGSTGGGGAQSSTPQMPGAQQGGGAAGGAQQGGQQSNAQGAGGAGAAGAAGDPNAKADGIQVAGLDGDSSAAGAAGAGGSGDNVPKPQQVAIGDKASQITPVANAPGVVGQQAAVANSTQQMESKIGKGAGAGPSGGNGGGRAVEKGRTMPSGL